ncbi:hypothetical protein C0991_010597 [Blastosporella zonata]|nr:hypothetical protein C0991_010597 [Blastosporella zonata]
MKFFATALSAAFAVSGALAQLTINTPILPGNQPTAQALLSFDQTSATSLTWTVNIAAGTSIGLDIRDSTGTVAQSAAFTVNPGTDSSCVGQNPSSTSSTATAGNTSPATTSAAATTTSTSATTTTAPATTAPTTTAAPTTSVTHTTTSAVSSSKAVSSTATSAKATSTNAAPTQAAGFGAAAFLGAAAVALFA